MPFIDARLTVPATPEQKEQLKSAFGQAVTALHKSETYLMVQIADELADGSYTAALTLYDADGNSICIINEDFAASSGTSSAE